MTSWAGPPLPRQQAGALAPNGHPQLGTSPTPVPFPDTMRTKETESHKGEVAGPGPREQWPWSPGSWLGHLGRAPPGRPAPVSFHGFTFLGFDTWKTVSAPIWTSAAKRSQPRGKVPPQPGLGPLCPREGTRGPAGGSHPLGTHRRLQGGSGCQGDSGDGGQPQPSAPAVYMDGRSLV